MTVKVSDSDISLWAWRHLAIVDINGVCRIQQNIETLIEQA